MPSFFLFSIPLRRPLFLFLLSSLLLHLSFRSSALTAHTAHTASIPFEICDGHQDLLGVTKIELTPYPAIAGEGLYITVEGQPSVDVEEETLVHMTIREGPLPAPSAEYSLCDSLLEEVKCPVKAGTPSRAQFLYNVTRLAPAGRATSTVATYDKAGQELSCIALQIDVVRNKPAINSWRRSNNMNN